MKLLSLILLFFNLNLLHELGFKGEGMTIAVIDAGFFRANDPTVFPQEQIIGVYDLLKEDSLAIDSLDIFDDPNNVHGTCVLSTMLYQDTAAGFVGTAPGASYYLIRTEDYYGEYKGEVDRLARAFYLADSLDADVITCSLGYYYFDDSTQNYSYADMDGSSPAAKAATELARHGRIVCVSAGNEGNKPWKYITTPADADSILTVGAFDAYGLPASFSSYGPTYDMRMKPEVSSLGAPTTVYNPSAMDATGSHYIGQLRSSNGTSFSCPQVAGMVACLWQAMPQLSAMELRQLIMESCSLYPYSDARMGYGEPDAWYAYTGERTSIQAIPTDAQNTCKQIENGRVIIIRSGQRYDVLGNKIP